MPQDNKIKIRRGLQVNLPAGATEAGELRYATDAQKLYVDDGSGNVQVGGNPTGFPVSTAQAAADAAILASAEAYADTLVVGLLDDRGNFDASGNTWPTTGGSGPAGAINKGDLWTISVAGVLGGHTVTAGDVIRALLDAPGSTDANWAIAENNFGYVAENSANKNTSGGYPGLTLFKLNLVNALGTVTSWFTTAATVARTWTMPDKDGTVAMTSDITATAVGLNNLTNDAQTKAAIVPNTTPSAGQILVGNAGGTAYAPVALSGPVSVTSTGVTSVATLNQNTTGSAATLTTPRNIDGQAFNGSADITVIAPGTHAATSKSTPVDADEVPLVDSAASNALKKLTWANLKATLKTYLDTLYQVILVSGTNIKTINSTSLLGSGDIVLSAAPGGSSGNLQGNISGAFAAVPNWAFDTTTGAMTYTGGTVTASTPMATYTQTLNNAAITFVAKTNAVTATAANISSVIENWKGGTAGTTVQMAITALGGTASNGPAVVLPAGVLNSPGLSFGSSNVGNFGAPGLFACTTNTGIVYGASSTSVLALTSNGLSLKSDSMVRWSASGPDVIGWDICLARNAVGVLEVNNQTAGTYRDLVARNLFTAPSSANGQSLGLKCLTELTTIAAAATTDTAIQMPANSVVIGVSVRVTTAITCTSTFTVGDSGSAARFGSGLSKAVNTTNAGTVAPYVNASALSVRITPDTTPSDATGRVRVTIYYFEVANASS